MPETWAVEISMRHSDWTALCGRLDPRLVEETGAERMADISIRGWLRLQTDGISASGRTRASHLLTKDNISTTTNSTGSTSDWKGKQHRNGRRMPRRWRRKLMS